MNAVINRTSPTTTTGQATAQASTMDEAAKYVESTDEGKDAARQFIVAGRANPNHNGSQSYGASLLVESKWDEWGLSKPGVNLQDPATWKNLPADAQKALLLLLKGPVGPAMQAKISSAANANHQPDGQISRQDVIEHNKWVYSLLVGHTTPAPTATLTATSDPKYTPTKEESVAYVKASDEYEDAAKAYATSGKPYSPKDVLTYAATLLIERNYKDYQLDNPQVRLQDQAHRTGVTEQGKKALTVAFDMDGGFTSAMSTQAGTDKTNPDGQIHLKHIAQFNANTKASLNPAATSTPAPSAPMSLQAAEDFVINNSPDVSNLNAVDRAHALHASAARLLEKNWNLWGLPPAGVTEDPSTWKTASGKPLSGAAESTLTVLFKERPGTYGEIDKAGQGVKLPNGYVHYVKDGLVSYKDIAAYAKTLGPPPQAAGPSMSMQEAEKVVTDYNPGLDKVAVADRPEAMRSAAAKMVAENWQKWGLPDSILTDQSTWGSYPPEAQAALKVLFKKEPSIPHNWNSPLVKINLTLADANEYVKNWSYGLPAATPAPAPPPAVAGPTPAELNTRYGAMDETETARAQASKWMSISGNAQEQKELSRPVVATKLIHDHWDEWGFGGSNPARQIDDPATWEGLQPEAKAALQYVKDTGMFANFDRVFNGRVDNFITKKDLKLFLDTANTDMTEAGKLAGTKWDDHHVYGKGFSREHWVEDTSPNARANYLSNQMENDPSNVGLQIRKQAIMLRANHTLIATSLDDGDSRHITAKKLDSVANNKNLSPSLSSAANLYSEPAFMSKLDVSNDMATKLRNGPDGKVSTYDIEAWVKNNAPKDTKEVLNLLPYLAMRHAAKGVDISKVGPDFFNNLDQHPPELKAAVLFDLMDRKMLLDAGGELWHSGKANENGLNPNSNKVTADLDSKIAMLSNDKATSKYVADNSLPLSSLVNSNPGLKAALQVYKETQYDKGISLNAALNTQENPKSNGTDNNIPTAKALRLFAQETAILDEALGSGSVDATKALNASGRTEEVKKAYQNDIVEGNSLNEDITKSLSHYSRSSYAETAPERTGKQQAAIANYTADTAAYASVLGMDFVKKDAEKINANGVKATLDSISEQEFVATFYDAEGKFNESRIKELRKSHPELFVTAQGKPLTDEQIVKLVGSVVNGIRASEKFSDAFNKAFSDLLKTNENENIANDKTNKANHKTNTDNENFNKNYAGKTVNGKLVAAKRTNLPTDAPTDKLTGMKVHEPYKAGYMHGLSVLVGATALGFKLVQSSGKPMTERAIGDAAIASAGLLGVGMDGYSKFDKYYNPSDIKSLEEKVKDPSLTNQQKIAAQNQLNQAKRSNVFHEKFLGNGGKILGGFASGAGGVFSVIDGIAMLKKGDTPGGAISISSGLLAIISGFAGVGEGLAGFAASGARMAGMFGMLGSVAGWTAAGLVFAYIGYLWLDKALQDERRGEIQDNFHRQLGDLKHKYGITGGPVGPSDWPEKPVNTPVMALP